MRSHWPGPLALVGSGLPLLGSLPETPTWHRWPLTRTRATWATPPTATTDPTGRAQAAEPDLPSPLPRRYADARQLEMQ